MAAIYVYIVSIQPAMCFGLRISTLFDFPHLRFRYIAGVIKNIAKRRECFPRALLHRRDFFSVTR